MTLPAKGLAAIAAFVLLSSCGYHVAGKANLLPQTLHTIAIPGFGNVTTTYKLTDQLSAAMSREILSRTKYQVVSDARSADARLTGTIVQIATFPTVYDPVTFRAANIEVHVQINVNLTDRNGKVLFDRRNMEIRERYEVSVDPKVYFDESEVAMQRLAKDVARSVISAILENF